MFDGEKLWEADMPSDMTDPAFQPPRDAEVWDGDKFVPVPLTDEKTVDMDALESVAGEPPDDGEEEEVLPKKRGRRK